jgi:hypothetical protein
LDEDYSNQLYDYSYFGNNCSVSETFTGSYLWDRSWDLQILNEETWTVDFKTYSYLDKGILF